MYEIQKRNVRSKAKVYEKKKHKQQKIRNEK